MDLFEDLFDKAKDAFDVAVKATGEAVDTGKQKFNIATLESKIAKDYKTLGELYYAKQKGEEIEDSAISSLIIEIDAKKEKIKEIKEELKKAKAKRICASCGASIEENTVFCSFCGAKLEFTSEEK